MSRLKIAFCAVISVFGLSLLSVSAFAENSSVSQLNNLLGKIESLHGKFEQIITDEEQDIVEENSGEFWLKRPGNFRWEVKPPFAKTLVSDGKTLSTYDPDLEQLTIEAVNTHVMESPMILLSGDVDAIEARYQVATIQHNTANTQAAFLLTPKSKDAVFTKLVVRFNRKLISEMELHNTLGEIQHYTFSDLEINSTLAAELFQFEPPENTDVLQLNQ